MVDDYIDDTFLDNEINFPVTIEKRCSQDLQVNSYGRSLLELCIGNNLIALNGRTKGDFLGQFTCHTYNGASVVHYVIGSHDIQFSIINLLVILVINFPIIGIYHL